MSQTNVDATAARQVSGADAVAPPAEIAAKHPAMRTIEGFAEALIVLTLLGELLLVLANVFARVYLHRSFLWSDEAARLSLSILAFIGGAGASPPPRPPLLPRLLRPPPPPPPPARFVP